MQEGEIRSRSSPGGSALPDTAQASGEHAVLEHHLAFSSQDLTARPVNQDDTGDEPDVLLVHTEVCHSWCHTCRADADICRNLVKSCLVMMSLCNQEGAPHARQTSVPATGHAQDGHLLEAPSLSPSEISEQEDHENLAADSLSSVVGAAAANLRPSGPIAGIALDAAQQHTVVADNAGSASDFEADLSKQTADHNEALPDETTSHDGSAGEQSTSDRKEVSQDPSLQTPPDVNDFEQFASAHDKASPRSSEIGEADREPLKEDTAAGEARSEETDVGKRSLLMALNFLADSYFSDLLKCAR